MEIWKYRFGTEDTLEVKMPENSEILCLQTQYMKKFNIDVPCVWCLVDPKENLVLRRFCLFGTGHLIENIEHLHYIGTFQVLAGLKVGHLFEVIDKRA